MYHAESLTEHDRLSDELEPLAFLFAMNRVAAKGTCPIVQSASEKDKALGGRASGTNTLQPWSLSWSLGAQKQQCQ